MTAAQHRKIKKRDAIMREKRVMRLELRMSTDEMRSLKAYTRTRKVSVSDFIRATIYTALSK